MGLIAPLTSIALRPHLVRVETRGEPVKDREGGYTEHFVPLDPPTLLVRIEPSAGQDLQHAAEGTVVATITHTVTGPHHPGLTTEAQLLFDDEAAGVTRTFRVTGIVTPSERRTESVLLCVETTT